MTARQSVWQDFSPVCVKATEVDQTTLLSWKPLQYDEGARNTCKFHAYRHAEVQTSRPGGHREWQAGMLEERKNTWTGARSAPRTSGNSTDDKVRRIMSSS